MISIDGKEIDVQILRLKDGTHALKIEEHVIKIEDYAITSCSTGYSELSVRIRGKTSLNEMIADLCEMREEKIK